MTAEIKPQAWIDCEHCGRLGVWGAGHVCQCDTCNQPIEPEAKGRCAGCVQRVRIEVQKQYAEIGRQLAAMPEASERERAFLDWCDAGAAQEQRDAVMGLSRALHVIAQIPGALALVRRALDRAEARVLQERGQQQRPRAAGGKR